MKLQDLKYIRGGLERRFKVDLVLPLPPVMLALLSRLKEAEEEACRSKPINRKRK